MIPAEPYLLARYALLVAALAAAVGWDLARRRVPNGLTLPTFALGLLLGLLSDGSRGMMESLAGGLLGLTLLLVPYVAGGIGAGDVKLLVAVGSVGGVSFVLHALVWGALAGGAMAVAVITVRYAAAWWQVSRLAPGTELRGSSRLLRLHLPYAPAIAAGALVTVAQGGLN